MFPSTSQYSNVFWPNVEQIKLKNVFFSLSSNSLLTSLFQNSDRILEIFLLLLLLLFFLLCCELNVLECLRVCEMNEAVSFTFLMVETKMKSKAHVSSIANPSLFFRSFFNLIVLLLEHMSDWKESLALLLFYVLLLLLLLLLWLWLWLMFSSKSIRYSFTI